MIGKTLPLAALAAGLCMAAQAGTPVRIAKYHGDRKAALSYTFDDGLRDQLTHAAPMLEKHGFRGTFFVIAGRVSPTVEDAEKRKGDKRAWGTITWEELRGMSEEGHEIASHSWTHRAFPGLSPAEVEEELEKPRAEILRRIGREPLTFAFPFNQSDAVSEAAALRKHVAFRSRQTGAGGERTTVQWLDGWADRHVKAGGWGILMMHGIERGYAAFTDPEIFAEHLSHVEARGEDIWVGTFADVSRYILERDAAVLSFSTASPGKITGTLSCPLDEQAYDVPLTLVAAAPGAKSAQAERGGRALPARISGDSILVDAAPSDEPITITWQ